LPQPVGGLACDDGTFSADIAGVSPGDWISAIAVDQTVNPGDTSMFATNVRVVDYPAPTLSHLSPNSGTNTGIAVIGDVHGTGFRAGATIALKKAGQPDIPGQSLSVIAPERISCAFDLSGAATGAWDVVVTNDDNKTATLAGGFSVALPTVPVGYLAEGSTAWGFSTTITILNPNNMPETARITYMDPHRTSGTGVLKTRLISLPAQSQTKINANDDLGCEVDFSTLVESMTGHMLTIDRTMMWTGPGAAAPEAHSSIAALQPSAVWYLPEGSSAWGFETWTLVLNPGPTDAKVGLTYMIEGTGPVTKTHTVPAYSRATFGMADDIGASMDASIKVTSDQRVVAERSIYRNNRREGSCSLGATAPSKSFYLAEGSTAWGFTTYVLVQNPNNSQAKVTLTYQTPDGPIAQPAFTMPANSRRTVRVNDVKGLSKTDLSTSVSADKPIVAERAMYWDNGTGEACHDSIGLARPAAAFFLPDGCTDYGWETWTIVQNPNPEPVRIAVTYMTPTGKGNVRFDDVIPAGSRRTYSMSDKIKGGNASIMVFSLVIDRPIMVERSMYKDNKSAGTDTIGDPAYLR